jgi:hypothetical protein
VTEPREPRTPDESIPQDPGISGRPRDAERADETREDESLNDEPGTDALGREPRLRRDE